MKNKYELKNSLTVSNVPTVVQKNASRGNEEPVPTTLSTSLMNLN